MPSPDLSGFVDLTLFDKNPQDIFEAALNDLRSRLPSYVAYEGSIDAVLLAEFALESAEAVYAINRLPGTMAEVLFTLLNVTRFAGAPATVNVTFTLSDALGHVVPAGTRVSVALDSGLDPAVFTTDANLQVPAGSTTGTVSATATTLSSSPNGLGVGSSAAVVDSIFFVNTAQLASTAANGQDPESTTAWLARASTVLTRLNTTLVLPEHFTAYALLDPLVTRALTVDQYNGATSAPNSPGYLTTAVYGPSGTVSAAEKASLQTAMRAASQANLSVTVVDPTVTAVDVTATVTALPGQVAATVQAAAVAALQGYLSPQTWQWSGTVRVNELVALLSNVAGVDYVASVTTPSADKTLPGVAPLATYGQLQVTVT